MTDAAVSKPCWFRPTPGGLVLLLLAGEGVLWLSEHFGWFAFNRHKGYTVLAAVAAVGVFFLLMLLWLLLALIFRWRFQFSIRSLLVLTLAVAIPCSWLATEMKAAKGQKAVVEEIERLGGWVCYDYQRDPSDTTSKPPEPAWLRRLLGDGLFVNVTWVILYNSEISDAGLEHLKGLTQLQVLFLSKTKVSDAGLERLKGWANIQWLRLNDTKVSDAGVKKLQQALPKCSIQH